MKGDHKVEKVEEYSSDNTERLDVAKTKKKLLGVSYVNAELAGKDAIPV